MLVLLLNRLESASLQGGGLCVADGMFNDPFAIGVANPRGVRHDAVVLQSGGVNGIELGLVQVGLDDTFLEVVQDHVAATTTEIAPGLFMQSGPCFLAGLPHDPAK